MADNEKAMDSLVRKIRALRAKGEGTDNEAEAAIFLAKAQAMMAEHGLTAAALEEKDQEPVDLHHMPEEKSWSPTRVQMANALAKLYMTRMVKTNGTYVLVGRASNVAVVKEMLAYLTTTTRRLSRAYSPVTTIQVDWRRGCFIRLAERLNRMRHDQTAAAPIFRGGNPGNLPALYQSESRIVEAGMYRIFPNLVSGKRKKLRAGDHAQHGRAAADGISLNTQLRSGGGQLMIGRK